MIIGENAKEDDLDVNPLKEKKLTNVAHRAADEAMRLTPPRRMSLEQAIAYIGDDELVEVTPKSDPLTEKVALAARAQARGEGIGTKDPLASFRAKSTPPPRPQGQIPTFQVSWLFH